MNLKDIYKDRNVNAHKGQFGYVLIVSGSKMYSGSPVFNAVSVLRSGADLITVVGHERAMNVVAGFSPDMITYPLDGELSERHVSQVLSLSQKFDALVIGGGLDRSEEAYEAIRKIISSLEIPMVIDAEAIRVVSSNLDILRGKKVVLTPNVPEFEILTGEKNSENLEERRIKVKNIAEKFGITICLKGSIDIVSDGLKIIENKTGNVFMTKGGFGDTLAGICGALLARGVEPLLAAEGACFINGSAGDLAAEEYGEGLMASDIFEFIPKVISG